MDEKSSKFQETTNGDLSFLEEERFHAEKQASLIEARKKLETSMDDSKWMCFEEADWYREDGSKKG